jgi:hypothetical protein
MAVFIAVIILISIAIAFSLCGFLGGSLESAIPPVIENSPWNASENPALVTGPEIWQTGSQLLSGVVIVCVAGIVLSSIFKKKEDREDQRPDPFER